MLSKSIQNHFGAITQIAIGGMFGLAQVSPTFPGIQVPSYRSGCGPGGVAPTALGSLGWPISHLLMHGSVACRCVRPHRGRVCAVLLRAVPLMKPTLFGFCFLQPVLLSFPLERPIFLREYATVRQLCTYLSESGWRASV